MVVWQESYLYALENDNCERPLNENEWNYEILNLIKTFLLTEINKTIIKKKKQVTKDVFWVYKTN